MPTNVEDLEIYEICGIKLCKLFQLNYNIIRHYHREYAFSPSVCLKGPHLVDELS